MVADTALLARVLAVARPPLRDKTHAEVASQILLPDGPRQGKPYTWQDDPVAACVISQLDQPWDSMALPGAVQTGKSLMSVLVPALRQLIFQRRAVVYAQPSQQKLHEAWAGKVRPAIEGAGWARWLPTGGQGSKGGETPRFVVFRDPVTTHRAGMLYLIHGGGRNEGAQASVSAPTVLVDEVDSFQSAHRVALIGKRADSFGAKAVRIYTSTVKADGEPGAKDGSIILGLYQDSTRSRLWFACPHCGAWQTLEWENVRYDEDDEATAAETVHMVCPKCEGQIYETDRQKMLRQWRLVHHSQTVTETGEVVGAAPRTRRFGLLWTALDSSLRDLPTLAIEHWRAARALARGDHGAMRSFWRDQLCRPYTGDILKDDDGALLYPTLNRLVANSEGSDYHTEWHVKEEDGESRHLVEVPSWVQFLTMAADVQRGSENAPGRLYWTVYGRGEARGALCGWGILPISPKGSHPTVAELHAGLDRLDGTLREWQRPQPLVRFGVDVGDRQTELVQWIRTRRDWHAIKGTRDLQASKPGDMAGWIYPRQQPDNFILYLVPTHSVIRSIHGELIAPIDGPGSCALPHGLTRADHILRHIVGTIEYEPGKWSEKPEHRKFHPEWNRRIDYLHCFAYARALAYYQENRRRNPNRKYGVLKSL